jgi:eukaryotic-like serine/threonine-protein kinase
VQRHDASEDDIRCGRLFGYDCLSDRFGIERADAGFLMTVIDHNATSSIPLSEAPTGLLVSSSPGDRIAGRYSLLGLLGAGGMGTVYRARDEELDELIALKMLLPEFVDEAGMLERFRREVKLARRVTHKNVARVFDIGEHGSSKYLTMEYIEGETLSARLSRQGAMPVVQVVDIALSICAGLSAAHAAGVVHRDLKPENVMIAKDGRVVVMDFGIARARVEDASRTQVGAAIGTPAYMSPEQVQGLEDIDSRADIYALGAMLYELLTGVQPWRGDSIVAVAAARLMQPPPDPCVKRPSLPVVYSELVKKCMARDREQRFASADEVAATLTHLLSTNDPAATGNTPHIVRTGMSSAIATSTAVVPSMPAPAPPPSTDKTVALLPFRNSGPPADDYLAEGLTDDLIDTLSMTSGLKVRPRGVVMRFKGVDQDPREIGKELGVQVVVEGSVRRAPAGLRITARVLSVADGFQLWAKRFDRPEKDLFVVNDEVATAIAEALTVDMTSPTRQAPTDPAAIELYLRARVEYRKFWAPGVRVAVELLEKALELAPNDSTILSGYASALARLAFYDGDYAQRAHVAAEKALAAAPHLPEAHLAMGHALMQLGDMANAVRSLRQCLQRAPSNAEAHWVMGMILMETGPLDDAERSLEAAQSLDPALPAVARMLARTSCTRHQWQRAYKYLETARTIDGEFSYLTHMLRFASWSRDEEAIERALAELDVPELNGPVQQLILETYRDRHSANTLNLRRNSFFTTAASWRRTAYFLQLDCEVAAYAHNDSHVAEDLRLLANSRIHDLLWFDHCPLFDSYRSLPEFVQTRTIVAARAQMVVDAFRGR